ncbi:MAG: galactosyltransferase-related protein [Pseudomonadota bacterium]
MISLVVPYRSDGTERARNWEWCRRRWLALLPNARLVECDSGHEPFNRGASINLGVANSFGDVLVIADADTVVSDVDAAVGIAETGGWSIAYDRDAYWTLTPQATERVLVTDPGGALSEPWALGVTDQDRMTAFSGVLVMPRAAFDAANGFDETLVGWGYDDSCFYVAMDTLWQPHKRAPGFALHLHHPRGLDYASPHIDANKARYEQYLQADSHPALMRELVRG